MFLCISNLRHMSSLSVPSLHPLSAGLYRSPTFSSLRVNRARVIISSAAEVSAETAVCRRQIQDETERPTYLSAQHKTQACPSMHQAHKLILTT